MSRHSIQDTLSLDGRRGRKSSADTERKTSIEFHIESAILGDSLFETHPRLARFNYTRIVTMTKEICRTRTTSGDKNCSRVDEAYRFLVNMPMLIREQIVSQFGDDHIYGTEDIMPILTNVFARAMVGVNRLRKEIFPMIDENVNKSCETDAQMYDIIKEVVEEVSNWLHTKQFIDNPSLHSFKNAIELKIVMLGSRGCGKTCLLRRYIYNQFTANTVMTIGLDYCSKQLDKSLCDFTNVLAHVWDTAGQERFRSITQSFLNGVHGIFYVYDRSENPNFDPDDSDNEENGNLQHYRFLLSDQSIPIVIFGNKTDKINMAPELRKGNNGKNHYWGSAKSGENVAEAFDRLICESATREYELRKAMSVHLEEKEQRVHTAAVVLQENKKKKWKFFGKCW